MRVARIISALAGRLRDLAVLDTVLLTSPVLSLRSRATLFLRRYLAVGVNARRLQYLGQTFHYENRLEPLLLPSYLQLAETLRQQAQLATARSVLDVGANVGQFGATVSRLHPDARVWSFEPNPVALGLLSMNAAGAEDGRWTAHPFGIAGHEHQAELWFVPGKSSQGSLFEDNAAQGLLRGSPQSAEVALRPLTPALCAFLGLPPEVDIVKIDVEGAERDALAGIAGIDWRYLLVEVSECRDGRMSSAELLTLVGELWGGACRIIWESAPEGSPVPSRDVLLMRAP